jgi:hypothetical protein
MILSFRIDANPEVWGRLIESSIGTHLINHFVSGRYLFIIGGKAIKKLISYWKRMERLLPLRLKAVKEVRIKA